MAKAKLIGGPKDGQEITPSPHSKRILVPVATRVRYLEHPDTHEPYQAFGEAIYIYCADGNFHFAYYTGQPVERVEP